MQNDRAEQYTSDTSPGHIPGAMQATLPLPRTRTAHKSVRLKYALVVVVIAVASFGAWQGWQYYAAQKLASQVPDSIRQSTGFDVYLPTQKGYTVQAESFIYNSGVLQFAAKNTDQTVQFAQQPKAKDFDLSKFATGIGISNAEQAAVAPGKVLYGKVGSLSIAIIDTGKTLVTITSTQPDTDLKPTAQSLQKVR